MDNLKIKDKNEMNIDLMINLYLDPVDIYIPIIKEEKFKFPSLTVEIKKY